MSTNVLNNRAVRISLACAPCRSRHLKCNGATPVCARCEQEGSNCVWNKSRRGGRPRNGGKSGASRTEAEAENGISQASPNPPSANGCSEVRERTNYRAMNKILNNVPADKIFLSSNQIQSSLLDLYYQYFHDAHPCALPRRKLETKSQEQTPELAFLIRVMQFIGSLYTNKVPTGPLEEQIKASLVAVQESASGFVVQALTLYATAVYWRDGYKAGKQILDSAIDKALFAQIYRREYALENAHGDLVLAESWRRTWWMLYTTEIHMAAIGHWPEFRTSKKYIDSTMELPCENWEYDAENIPGPRTELEYNDREFDAPDASGFSSFAYLIGLLRTIDQYIAGERKEEDIWSRQRCNISDAAILGWISLLPKHKRGLMRPDGDTDELLWKADCLIGVYVVEVHRPFSTLTYNPVEKVSSCAPPAPPECADATEYWDAPAHTKKIMTAIERQTDLLTLHSRRFTRCPFSICMIAAVTVTHLSACKYILSDEALRIARERIRAAIGTLETLAEVWSQGKRILWEVRTIAREVLGVGKPTSAAPSPMKFTDRQNEASLIASTPGAIDWTDFASQMAEFGAADFVGFEEYFEASFSSSEQGISTGTSSDIAVT